MSERLTLRCFKGRSTNQFRDAFAEQVERCGGEVHWQLAERAPDEDLRTTHQGMVHTVYLPYLSGADQLLCRIVGASLNVPWITMRIQEGSLWDYSLYDGSAHVDQFSTLPEYWDEDDATASERDRGDAELVSNLWEVPKARIERYLRHWGIEEDEESTFHVKLQGKAYSSDKYGYGSIYQMFDFLTALGGVDPMAQGILHRIIVPPIGNLRRAAELL